MTIAVIGTKGKQIVLRDKSQDMFVTIKSVYIVDTDPEFEKSHFKCLIQPEHLLVDKDGKVIPEKDIKGRKKLK